MLHAFVGVETVAAQDALAKTMEVKCCSLTNALAVVAFAASVALCFVPGLQNPELAFEKKISKKKDRDSCPPPFPGVEIHGK